jgi:hypothetical protein
VAAWAAWVSEPPSGENKSPGIRPGFFYLAASYLDRAAIALHLPSPQSLRRRLRVAEFFDEPHVAAYDDPGFACARNQGTGMDYDRDRWK